MRTTMTRAAAALVVAMAAALCVPGARAQGTHQGETFTLDATLPSNQTHEYTATHYIDLTPGFLSAPAHPNHTSLEIDPLGYEIHPPETGMTDMDGYVVGSIPGTVNIGSMGGLVYTIPIELPPGINGMEPRLAVMYNNQAGNGLMGWGWGLAGLSSVERVGRTRYHDGIQSGVTLDDDTDRFALDGVRLVKVADNNDSIEYRAEMDGMSRIMAYCVYLPGGGLFGQGPLRYISSFKVWMADGTFMLYGATSDSRMTPGDGRAQALHWSLSSVSDRYGNTVTYRYAKDISKGSHHISRIDYTSNPAMGTDAHFTVRFSYRYRSLDIERWYTAGASEVLDSLLASVAVYETQGGMPVARYDFEYASESKRQYHTLTSVALTAYDDGGNAERLRPTAIQWDSSNTNQVQVGQVSPSQALSDFPFTGDFDGDGYTDVVFVPYRDSTAYASTVDATVFLNDRELGFVHTPAMDIHSLPASLDWIHVLDINGDGLDDLAPCLRDTLPLEGHAVTSVLVYLNNPATHGFSYAGRIDIIGRADIITGDFDGNGNTDIVLLKKIWKVLPYNSGGKWETSMPHIRNMYYVGWSGDTLETRQLNTSSLEYLGPVYNTVTADFDGDGASEALMVGLHKVSSGFTGSTVVRIGLHGGTGCVTPIQTLSHYDHPCHNPGSDNPWCNVFPGDFNGDGKADILYNVSGSWRFCFSDGRALSAPLYIFQNGSLPVINCGVNLYYPSISSLDYGGQSVYKATVAVGDFDGDGCADIAHTSRDSDRIFFSSRPVEYPGNQLWFRKKFNGDTGVWMRTQHIHTGNFLGADNMSCLVSLPPSTGDRPVSAAAVVSINSTGRCNSVASVTDGLGNVTSFSYSCLTPSPVGDDGGFYSYSHAAPDTLGVRPVPVPALALRSWEASGPGNSREATSYSYTDALWHRDGHGFIGFRETVAETSRTGDTAAWRTRRVARYEHTTMGRNAMALPDTETESVNAGGVERQVHGMGYMFVPARFAGDTSRLVVCPAMTIKAETALNPDRTGETLAVVETQHGYSLGPGNTYAVAYGCVGSFNEVWGYRGGTRERELLSSTRSEMETLPGPWIINRTLSDTTLLVRGTDTVAAVTAYAYGFAGGYYPSSVTVVPNGGSNPNDPLTTLTEYTRDGYGNVTGTTVSAPFGTHGETPRTTSYEYGASQGHRLLTKETLGNPAHGYVTDYTYDIQGRTRTVRDLNMRTETRVVSALGTDSRNLHHDGTERRCLTLWADDSPHRPNGATHYTWERSTGGAGAMVFYHSSGAELRRVSYDLHGDPVYIDSRYDTQGRLEKVSEPYRAGSSVDDIRWTVYAYDFMDRISRVTAPDGMVTDMSYDGYLTTATVTPPPGGQSAASRSRTERVNALGWLVERVEGAGTQNPMRVSYGYRPDGSLAWSVVNGDENTRVSMGYDHAGNTTLVHDPDQCGTADGLVSEYNAYGEEVLRVTPRGAETEFSRDWLGRMTTRTVRYPGAVTETTVWAYSDTAPNRGTLASVSHPGRTVAYAYDTCQRLTGETVIPDDGGSHTTAYTYDPASRVASVTHPSGFTVRYRYDARGRLREQTDGRGETLLRVEEADPSGRVERMALGRHLVTAMEYDTARHTLTGTETRRNGTLLQKTRYLYDGFCNLAARKDMKRNMEETFGYDRLDRLTTVSFDAALSDSASYDGLGRMTAKTAGGQSVFSSAVYGVQGRPHAVSQASVAGDPFPTACQTVDYTAFDKVSVVRQGGDSLRYTYGFDRRRARMEEWRGSLRREKLYVGSCERVTETVAGATGSRWWTFLVGPGGVYAVVVTEGVSHSVHHILRDHLGSWTMVTDRDGAVEQELSYDAWGNLRDPGTWVNYGSAEGGGSQPMFDRGFTGHEHLYAFGLVNMDGRVYDPVMSCFLSPDLYVPGTADPRSYNRFAYCMHNPLRYVDPSGWRPRQPAPGSTPSTGDFIREIYAYSEKAYEPRDFGIHPPLMSEIEVVWMEENELHGGGSGIVIKGGWYKQGNRILWSSSFSSQEEMNRQGIDGTYLGHTFVDEKNQIYYSLLGYEIDMTAGNGLAGKIAPLIDESIIAYEQYNDIAVH